jgi:ferrochelatase
VAAKAQLGEPGWRFAFQSQGMSGGTWLGPTVEQTLLALKNEGHRVVLLQPIGFLCDHVEVLYDIDIVFKNFAREHGMELRRTESLNDSALLAEALMGIASERMRQVDATKAAAGSPQRK